MRRVLIELRILGYTFVKTGLEQAIYLRRSCLPLVEVELGGGDVAGGIAQS